MKVYVCLYLCKYVCEYVCVCVYGCMYVYKYVCMCVCAYVWRWTRKRTLSCYRNDLSLFIYLFLLNDISCM